MAKNEFSWLLDAWTRVVVVFFNEGHNVIQFVVKLECNLNGAWSEIARYDDFHGYVHRDMIGKDGGKKRTIKFEHLDVNSGLDAAIVDFKLHFEAYVRRWLDER